MNDQEAFAIAVEEARISFNEGGVPVSPHHQILKMGYITEMKRSELL